jgi:hypothetical protein
MTSQHLNGEEVIDLPPRPRITLPRTGTRPSERPSTAPTIDVMLLQAQEHRTRCERLLEVLGAPVPGSATTSSTKES